MKNSTAKNIVILLISVACALPLLTCESMDAGSWGDLAGGIAKGLGANDATANIAKGFAAGGATFAQAKKAADSLTPENEYYIGRAVAANLVTQYKIYNKNPALQLYLNKICDTITINSPKPDIYNGYHVAILDIMEINAFATSGGHIFITRGLLACTNSEDSLASVIAHEISHIQLQHGLTSIRNARYVDAATSGLLAGLSAGTGSESIAQLAGMLTDSVNEIIVTMVTNGYGKEQEFAADSMALSLMASAGYEPKEMLTMLHALEKNEKTGVGFGKTHPAPADRIANVNKTLGSFTVPDTTQYRKKRFGQYKIN